MHIALQTFFQRTLQLLIVAVFGLPLAATAGDIVIEHTAIRKMLMDQLFTNEGRYDLVRAGKCQFVYLDNPQVSIADGRVRIKIRLTTSLATAVDGKCNGTTDAVDIAASAAPYFSGENLGVTDVRIEEVSREAYRALLQAFVERALPGVLQVNLREALQRAVSDAKTPYEVTIGQVTVTALTAEKNRLTARVWFALSAR